MKNLLIKNMNKFMHSDWWLGALSGLGTMAISFVTPIKAFIVLSVALTLVDMITGIMAAKHRKEKINSRGLARTVQKMTLYTLAILSAEGLRIVFWEQMPFTYAAASVICLTEFKSLAENVATVTGADLWENLKSLLKKNNRDTPD